LVLVFVLVMKIALYSERRILAEIRR